MRFVDDHGENGPLGYNGTTDRPSWYAPADLERHRRRRMDRSDWEKERSAVVEFEHRELQFDSE